MSQVAELSAPRRKAMADLVVGAWDGTDELLAGVVLESRHVYAWRPQRAALAYAAAEMADMDGRVWMHPHEFKAWRAVAKVMAKVNGADSPEDDLGITTSYAADLCREDRTTMRGLKISKALALACAHYNLGFPKPDLVSAADFRAWFEPRFQSVERLAEFLKVDRRFLLYRLDGVDPKGNFVPAEGYLLRALDWLWRVGPVCPYGDRPAVQVWPGQEELGR